VKFLPNVTTAASQERLEAVHSSLASAAATVQSEFLNHHAVADAAAVAADDAAADADDDADDDDECLDDAPPS
jgi:hypothetical protein